MSKTRGNTLAFALVVMSFVLSTTVSLVSLHIMSRHNDREMNRVLATQVYDRIVTDLAEPVTITRAMASDKYLVEELRSEADRQEDFERDVAAYLAHMEQGLDCEAMFVISEDSHRYYTANGFMRYVLPAREHDEWYRQLLISQEPYTLDVDKDEYDASDLSVYVNAKITDTDGSVMGVCGVGVRMTGIQSLFRMLEEDFNVKISLVNPYGIVQVDTDVSSIERTSLAHLLGEDGETGYVYHDLGRGRFAVSKYIESMDWYLIVQSGDTGEASRFLNIILLNAGLCALVLVILFVALRRNRRHTEALAAASLVDNLTQLSNRRAFDEDRLALGSEASRANLVCVAIDVNGLKTANDTLGHDAGDELICGAATCMRDVFGPYGTTYRTGGDEFAALLHLDEGQLDEVRQAFDAAVAAWSGNEVKSLSVSCGYAPQREFPDQDVYGLCRIADERMYEDKSQYYARTGTDRRRT